MLTLPLEPTDDRADPLFKDPAGFAAWLSQLQLTNVQQAQGKLFAQLSELNRYPMRGIDRLETLECLGETVGYIQDEVAKKLIDKPLPLSDAELLMLQAAMQLWQAMVTGYQRCLQSHIAGDRKLSGHLLCQRCLYYSGLAIFEQLRTGHEPPPALWRQLHELYAHAEHQNLHLNEVPDPLSGRPTNCVKTYVKTLLACYANPVQMTRWQLQKMSGWLETWSSAVTVERGYRPSRNDAQPLAVELPGAQGLQRIESLKHHDEMRYLALVPLSKLLRVKIILLQQGQLPHQVGLGDQLDSNACLELLTLLHARWCENQRLVTRRATVVHSTLCCNLEGIFSQLSGQPFRQIGELAPKVTVHLENWQMENESIMGARLLRSDAGGARLRSKQLVAIRCGSFILGATAWTRVMLTGKLQMGVRYFPGKPQPVRMRPYGINPSDLHAPALLLPPLPAINTPASLIIPRDWFKSGRMVEISYADEKSSLVQLGFSVEHGLDYERVSFTNQPVAGSY